MASPQVLGSTSVRNVASTATLDISSVPTGGWMIVSTMISPVSSTVDTPSGWTVLHTGENSGSRRNYLYGKTKDGTEGPSVTFTIVGGASTAAFALVWGSGAGDIGSWVIGNSGLRAASGEPSGARYTNNAPSITTAGSDYTIIGVSNEATLAQPAPYEVASYTAGWTEQHWHPQAAVNDRIETIWTGSKVVSAAGVTGNLQVVYTSEVDANGWAIQVGLPSSSSVAQPITQVVGTPTTFVSGAVSNSFTVTRPSGIVNGDYIVVFVRGQSGATTVGPSSPGFTRFGPAFVASDVNKRTTGIYGKLITNAGTEPSSYTFSMTSTSARLIAVVMIVRHVDVNNPIAGFFDSYGGTVITNGRAVEAYSVATNPALAFFFAGSEFAANISHTPTSTPAGYTNQMSLDSSGGDISVSRTYAWIGSKTINTPTTTYESISWANSPSGASVEGIAFNSSTSTPVDPAGDGYASHNGHGQEVAVYLTTPAGPRTPSAMIPVRPGFSSVSAMLAKPGFTWAHRGGSASYPEHSLYAYTQSVVRGYGVLEVSLGRTSDGVWFGLHDQTTDRSSGGTYGNASSQTWAQIQAQQIVIGAEGAPQPYMSLAQLVSIYGKTHILVLDPKYALGSYRIEFLNLVDSLLGPTRAIIKYSGAGSGAANLSTEAQARGYQTWGFFYATDASPAQGGSGALQTWGPSWTLIGMEYGASQAIWNEAIALGKPVIAHIAPNQAAYDTAIAKGASGVQVSGVAVVNPVSWWTAGVPSIGSWSFSEGAGTTASDLVGGRTLTVVSGNWATGYKGGGLSSAGGTVVIPSKAGLESSARTLMFWANWNGNAGNWRWGVDFHLDALDTSCWGIMPINGSGDLYCRIRVGGTNTNIAIPNVASDGAWHHYAITYNGATFVAYRDGILVGSVALTGAIDICDQIVIHPSGGTNTIDSLRVFNRALTQAQINTEMNIN